MTGRVRQGELSGLIDSIYCVDVTDEEWLRGMVVAARGLIDDGLGAGAWIFKEAPNGVAVSCTANLSPLPLVAMGIELSSRDPDLIVKGHSGGPVGTFSESIGRAALRRSPAMIAVNLSRGVHDYLVVLAKEPDGWGVALSSPMRRMRRVAQGRRELLERVAAHVQAAHRLRRRLRVGNDASAVGAAQGSASGIRLSDAVIRAGSPDESANVQAVLDASGRVLDAEGDARRASAQQALREQARLVDRSRVAMSRGGVDDDEVLRQWKALVDGRWSLVDAFDADGRRVLLARRNSPGTLPHALLDERERAVLGYRAAGHSLKLIGYEMGFSVALTSRLLRRAMQKLGLHSVAELAAFRATPPSEP